MFNCLLVCLHSLSRLFNEVAVFRRHATLRPSLDPDVVSMRVHASWPPFSASMHRSLRSLFVLAPRLQLRRRVKELGESIAEAQESLETNECVGLGVGASISVHI